MAESTANADLDVGSLQDELKSLREQRSQARGRLRELIGRGRGRGRGGRGLSTRLGPPGINGRGGFGARAVNYPQNPQISQTPVEQPGRIRSTVVMRGRERLGRSDFIPPVLTKRPPTTTLDNDQNLKKRNKRMFGALLGTLQQFCEEDQRFQESTISQRRQEALQKAEERQQQHSATLMQKQAEEIKQKRYQEYCKLWDIDLEEELKLTEILYANKIKRHQKLVAFLKTSTGPTLYWLPAKHDEKTKGLLAEEGEKYKEWKVEQLKELESEKEKLKEDAAEKRRQKALRNSTTNSTTKPATHDPQQPSAGEHAASQQDQKEQEAKASGEHEEIPAPKQTLRSVAIPVNEDRNGAQQHRADDEEGELPYDAKKHAAEQARIEEEIAAEEMAQSDDLIDDIA